MKVFFLTKVFAFSAAILFSGATATTVVADSAISLEEASLELVEEVDADEEVENETTQSTASVNRLVDAAEDIWYR